MQKKPLKTAPVLVLSLALVLVASSCNIYKAVDQPNTDRQRYIAAVDLANKGDCETSVRYLTEIPSRNDQQNVALGWSYLCLSTATTKNIASTLYTFTSSSSSSDLTVIGKLSRAMYNVTDVKLQYVDKAIEAFSLITNAKIRSIEIAIAQVVKTSAILAHAAEARGQPIITRDLVADPGCAGASDDCTAGFAACIENPTVQGMHDSEVTQVVNAISAANTTLAGSGAADISAMVALLNTGLAGAPTSARCFIYKKMVPL